jgi:general secretion pathway protein M
MNLPTGVRGRLVAVALLLIPLILLYEYAFKPLGELYDGYRNDIATMQDRIVRYRRAIAELPALAAHAAELERTQPLAPFLLDGDNAALAAADLQRELQQAAKQYSVQILSLRVKPASDEGPLQRIAVEARLRTGTATLRDLLFTLETTQPAVFVDMLSINARAQRRRGVQEADVLDVRLVLSSMRAREPDISEG